MCVCTSMCVGERIRENGDTEIFIDIKNFTGLTQGYMALTSVSYFLKRS